MAVVFGAELVEVTDIEEVLLGEAERASAAGEADRKVIQIEISRVMVDSEERGSAGNLQRLNIG